MLIEELFFHIYQAVFIKKSPMQYIGDYLNHLNYENTKINSFLNSYTWLLV